MLAVGGSCASLGVVGGVNQMRGGDEGVEGVEGAV